MKVSVHSIINLPDELRFTLTTIWHPQEGDHFFFLDAPSEIHQYGNHNAVSLAENRFRAYPLFTLEQLVVIVEDYAGYHGIQKIVSGSTSSHELFCLLWEEIVAILKDGESAAFWNLTIPITKRVSQHPEDFSPTSLGEW